MKKNLLLLIISILVILKFLTKSYIKIIIYEEFFKYSTTFS